MPEFSTLRTPGCSERDARILVEIIAGIVGAGGVDDGAVTPTGLQWECVVQVLRVAGVRVGGGVGPWSGRALDVGCATSVVRTLFGGGSDGAQGCSGSCCGGCSESVSGAASVASDVGGAARGSESETGRCLHGLDVASGSSEAEKSFVCESVESTGVGASFSGEKVYEERVFTGVVPGLGASAGESRGSDGSGDLTSGVDTTVRGKWYAVNKRKREKKRALRGVVPEWRRGARPLVDGSGGCVSDESVTGSVRTVDTRTGVEIAAAQTLAARRVAENERAEAEAKVAKKLAEHRLVALQDKDRTVAVQRLAAARYEQRINEAKAKSQASYKKCDESMKSLGSTGSAGEFALKQAVKEARDNAKTLKYVQEQADLFYQYATPEVRRMVAEMPEPEMEDEFDVFGDCPSDYNDEQREAYYDDLNRRNAEHGLVGSSPVPPRRELTPEEFLKIEEEIRALSANQV